MGRSGGCVGGIGGDDETVRAGDFEGAGDGHCGRRRKVDDLVVAEFVEVEFEVFGGAVVYLDRTKRFHPAPRGDVVGVFSAEMEHAAARIDGKESIVQRREEVAVEFA